MTNQFIMMENESGDNRKKSSFIYKLAVATINHEKINDLDASNGGSTLMRSLFISLIQYYPSIYTTASYKKHDNNRKNFKHGNTYSSSSSSSSSNTNNNNSSSNSSSTNNSSNSSSNSNGNNWLQQYIVSLQSQQQYNAVLKLHSCKVVTELLAHDLNIYKNYTYSYKNSNIYHNTINTSAYIPTRISNTVINDNADKNNNQKYDNKYDLSKVSLICASSSVEYTISMLINMLQDKDHLIRTQAAVAIGGIPRIIWEILEQYPINCLFSYISNHNNSTIINKGCLTVTTVSSGSFDYHLHSSKSYISVRLYIISILMLNMKDKVGSVRAASYKGMGDCILHKIFVINNINHNNTDHDDTACNQRNNNKNNSSISSSDNSDSVKDINSSNSSDVNHNNDVTSTWKSDYQLISTLLRQLLSGCHDSNLTVRIQAVWTLGM